MEDTSVILYEMLLERFGAMEDVVREMQSELGRLKQLPPAEFDLTADNLSEKRKQNRLGDVRKTLLSFDTAPPIRLRHRLDQEQIELLRSRGFEASEPWGPECNHSLTWATQ